MGINSDEATVKESIIILGNVSTLPVPICLSASPAAPQYAPWVPLLVLLANPCRKHNR